MRTSEASPGLAAQRRIAFHLDESALNDWLPQALAGAGSATSFKGLWFGLNNPVVKGAVTADIYVGASESYASDSLDWAMEPAELSKPGYLRSKVLDAIYSLAYGRDGGLENDAEYPLVLAYGSMCAREALERTPRAGAIANCAARLVVSIAVMHCTSDDSMENAFPSMLRRPR